MRFVLTERKRGKTALLVNWFLHDKENRYICVANSAQARLIQDAILKMLPPPLLDEQAATRHIEQVQRHILIASNFEKYHGTFTRDAEIGIDNLEHVLPVLLGTTAKVEVVTATVEPLDIAGDDSLVDDIRTVLEYVSVGRSGRNEPMYPDATARKALGALYEKGIIKQ